METAEKEGFDDFTFFFFEDSLLFSTLFFSTAFFSVTLFSAFFSIFLAVSIGTTLGLGGGRGITIGTSRVSVVVACFFRGGDCTLILVGWEWEGGVLAGFVL